MTEDYPDPPRTEHLDLAVVSDAESPEEFEDKWGVVVDEETIRRLDTLLGGGEGDLNVNSMESGSVSTEQINNTHYVATDDDAETVIQDANEGDTVIFLPGIHENTAIHIENKNDITLIGQGAVLEFPPGLNDDDRYTNLIELENCENWEIGPGLILDGNGDTQEGATNFEDTWVNIYLNNCRNVVIYGNEIRDAYQSGITMGQGTESVAIFANHIHHNNCGILTHNMDVGTQGSGRNVSIVGNVIEDNDQFQFTPRPGVYLAVNSQRCAVVGNIIKSQIEGQGVRVHVGGDFEGGHHIIANNSVDTAGSGIYLTNPSTGMTVVGNEVRSGASGIVTQDECHRNTISNNLVYECGNIGIRIRSESNSVTGNGVLNCASEGIYMNASAEKNTVADNVVAGCGGQAGIRVFSPLVGIAGNIVVENDLRGIMINDGADHCRLVRNYVLNNSQEDPGGHHGVSMSADNCYIAGNVSGDDQETASQATGFREPSSGTDNEYSGNDAFGNVSNDWHLDGDRTTFDGFVGGGPVDGVDLTTVSGQYYGQMAIADGTAEGTSLGDIARWNGWSDQWQVFNSDTTEQPS